MFCKLLILWSGRSDLNRGPSAPKADALPGCATPRLAHLIVTRIGISLRMVILPVHVAGLTS